MSPTVRKLMARNVMQVLGRDCLSPASFVVCWAPGSTLDEAGRVVDTAGGTGQAVRIAATYRIPVFNLAHPPHQARIGAWLAGNP